MFHYLQNVTQRSLYLVFGLCLIFIAVTKGAYAMQPPPPPLDAAQLRELVSKADLIVIGKITEINETASTIESVICLEKIMKGKFAGKTIHIKETFKPFQTPDPGAKDKGGTKRIVSTVVGPNTYHGRYEKGARIVLLLEKNEGAVTYKPLGSGTYTKHLCEFFIEDGGIKTRYFKFADDVVPYAENENEFIRLIERIIEFH